MIPFNQMLLFILAALILVISLGPNMIYLISRTITQGKKAGLISLGGVMCGFLFHIIMVSFGLTAILFAIPLAYIILKFLGVVYLLYLAYKAIKPNSNNIFEASTNLQIDAPPKLFLIGLLTNVLNPKVALFYLSFFPQFIKEAYGNIFAQSLQIGITQMLVSFSVNFIIIISASTVSVFFANNPKWIKAQKWFMASILAGLALKMAFTKVK